MEDYKVAQIQVLDENGYWKGETFFINIDTFADLVKHFKRLRPEGKIVESYTTIRTVKLS